MNRKQRFSYKYVVLKARPNTRREHKGVFKEGVRATSLLLLAGIVSLECIVLLSSPFAPRPN